jgi:hypothetical protein
VVIVEESIASLKVAAIFWLTGTPVAAFAGFVKITVGGVVSGVAPVVKLQTKSFAIAVPLRFVTPVVMVAVNKVLDARLLAGAKVAILFIVS